jgi:hypothetical protein
VRNFPHHPKWLKSREILKFRKQVPQNRFAELAELDQPVDLAGENKFRRQVPHACGTCGTSKFRSKFRNPFRSRHHGAPLSGLGSFSTHTSGFSTGRTV